MSKTRLTERRKYAKRNGAPPECAEAFAIASEAKPTMGEFVDFLKVYLSR